MSPFKYSCIGHHRSIAQETWHWTHKIPVNLKYQLILETNWDLTTLVLLFFLYSTPILHLHLLTLNATLKQSYFSSLRILFPSQYLYKCKNYHKKYFIKDQTSTEILLLLETIFVTASAWKEYRKEDKWIWCFLTVFPYTPGIFVKGHPEPEKLPFYLITSDSTFSIPTVSRLLVLELKVQLDNN